MCVMHKNYINFVHKDNFFVILCLKIPKNGYILYKR